MILAISLKDFSSWELHGMCGENMSSSESSYPSENEVDDAAALVIMSQHQKSSRAHLQLWINSDLDSDLRNS